MSKPREGGAPAPSLPSRARALADAGAWADVSALLGRHRESIRPHAPTATLYAESLVRTGRASEARTWLESIVPAITRDRSSLRRATVLTGAAYFELGDLASARRWFHDTLELAREEGDEPLVARAMNNLGAVENVQGRRAEAIANYQLAAAAHQRMGSARGLAECYHNMAITFRDLSQLDNADELEQRCVEFARDLPDPRLVALARLGRAEIALRRGDAALAEASARRVARDFANGGDPVREADALRLAGVACTTLGRFDDARQLLDEAVDRTRQHGALLNQAESLRARAELSAAVGRLDDARTDAASALRLFEELRAIDDAAKLTRWIEGLPVE